MVGLSFERRDDRDREAGDVVKVLVVEDDETMAALLVRGLTSEGYQITRVANGMDALIAVANTPFAAAAIDVMLPEMSGYEICRHLRTRATCFRS